jgi:hypothetical protein
MKTYQALPVIVAATQIKSIVSMPTSATIMAVCEDGSTHELSRENTSRYRPVLGDYIVILEDGFKYVDPRAVFERTHKRI